MQYLLHKHLPLFPLSNTILVYSPQLPTQVNCKLSSKHLKFLWTTKLDLHFRAIPHGKVAVYKQYLLSLSTNSEADCPVISNQFSGCADYSLFVKDLLQWMKRGKRQDKGGQGRKKEIDSVRKTIGVEQKKQKGKGVSKSTGNPHLKKQDFFFFPL